MKLFLFIFSSFITISCQSSSSKVMSPNSSPPVLQGLTTDSTTQISILRHSSQSHSYTIEPSVIQSISVKKIPTSSWVVDHLYIKDLNINSTYKLIIKNNAQKVIDEREFKSIDLNKTNIQISIASCMDYRQAQHQEQIWNEFNSHGSDLQFFIGDNVYADTNTAQKGVAKPSELWDRYVKTWNLLSIFKTKKLRPTLATWDDHDFGNNGGGENYVHKNESKNIFNSFFAQDNIEHSHFKKGPGISYSYKIGDQLFYFMDNRSFRTNKKTKPDSHWGTEQQQWLIKSLKANNQMSWLINGNQFFGAYQRFESFEKNHPTSFVDLIKNLQTIKTRVGFISGDRHLTELMKISSPDLPYDTLELTTSAIHAKVYPSGWGKNPNPRQIYGKANELNYAVINSTAKSGVTDVEIKAYGLNKQLFYKHKQIIK